MATLNIRNFPDRLYRRIRRRAAKNRRSISQEVVELLDRAVTEKPKVSLLDLAGLGKKLWQKELKGKDAAESIAEERASWD